MTTPAEGTTPSTEATSAPTEASLPSTAANVPFAESSTAPTAHSVTELDGSEKGQSLGQKSRISRIRLKDRRRRHDDDSEDSLAGKDTDSLKRHRHARNWRMDSYDDRHRHRHHRHRHHHHHQHRPRRPHHRQREAAEDGEAENRDEENEMNAEDAFREALFDAMADDEGAAYWEGVYGQPIHIYPNTRPVDPANPDGELERMTDDEYTAYVRGRMWEKTHQHILEERKAREEAANRRRESRKRTAQMEDDRQNFQEQIEESLRRGADRRRDKFWRSAWTTYEDLWSSLVEQNRHRSGAKAKGENSVVVEEEIADQTNSTTEDNDKRTRGKTHADTSKSSADHKKDAPSIPWPVQSGKQTDIEKQAVEEFFHHSTPWREGKEKSIRAMLKSERVRWHPDKMSHLLQGKMDVETVRSVTAVFQIIDAMWSKTGEATK